jgi:hypothetical protein
LSRQDLTGPELYDLKCFGPRDIITDDDPEPETLLVKINRVQTQGRKKRNEISSIL